MMTEKEIKEGDIVEIDYVEEFTKEHINEGKALVIWKGFNGQPLVRKLNTKTTIWTCYEYIAKVVGHIDIEDYMDKALEKKPKIWDLDDAREDFIYDVYNTLDFLPTNNEANRIIDSFDRVTSGIDCSDIFNKIQAEIEEAQTYDGIYIDRAYVLEIIDKYKACKEGVE